MSSQLARYQPANRRYNLFLLLVAGLGGLLYGVDVGIIGGALPLSQATSHLTPGQLSVIVAAVLLGSVFPPCSPASSPTGSAASRSWSSAA
jgi:SP family myo-inositol transporter-like MFS transporter 13